MPKINEYTKNPLTHALGAYIRSIRPDMSPEAISTAIHQSESNATIVIAGEMQDLKSHIIDMLEKLSRRL